VRRAAVIAAACALLSGCGGGADAGSHTAPPPEPTATAPPSATTPAPPGATTPAGTRPAPGAASPLPLERVDLQTPQPDRPSLYFVGDSLGVGTAPFLKADLPDWTVSIQTRGGLITGIGMSWWRAQTIPYTVSAFSLFTNDDPRNVAALEDVVRESVERTFSRCAIWATVRGWPRDGVDYHAANALLYRLAREYGGRLLIVPWAETVDAHPGYVLDDQVHPTDEGNFVRARMYADAARRCLREHGGIPAPE